MINLLYIGNKLRDSSSNISSIQVLGRALGHEGYHMIYASSKSNKVLRLLDMVLTCLKSYRKVDCVLIDTYSTQNFYYALVISQLCRLLKLPYIPILHGGNLESRLKHYPKFSRLIFKYSKVNIAPSPFIKSVFESYGYFNIVSIPNALDINNYSFRERHIDTIKLLWVRSFSKIYNPSLAVKVLKQLTNKGYKAELCMVGPDSGDGSFQETQQIAKKLDVPVTFTGKLPKSEWITLAENYNVFINTTNFDNMPVSVIEAMAIGLPIVSTNVGGIPYLIEHEEDGLLVPANNVLIMTDSIVRLKQEPSLTKTVIKNARTKVETYDWEIVKQEWFKVLNR